MELFILVGILFILWLVFRSTPSKSTSPTKSRTYSNFASNMPNQVAGDIESEAQMLASKVSTVAGLERLEERLDDTNDKLADASTEASEKKLEHKISVLERALEIAEDKEVKWIFAPEFSAFESLKRLKLAFKPFTEIQRDKHVASGVLTLEDFSGITLESLRDNEDDIVSEMATEDEVEFLPELIAFRKIIEGKSSVAIMSKKIDEWVEKNKTHEMIEDVQWWWEDTELTYAEAFFAAKMELDGLPCAEEFYSKGYTTPEKCLEIDPEEFISWHGVGPKTKESLIKYQDKVRQRLSLESQIVKINK